MESERSKLICAAHPPGVSSWRHGKITSFPKTRRERGRRVHSARADRGGKRHHARRFDGADGDDRPDQRRLPDAEDTRGADGLLELAALLDPAQHHCARAGGEVGQSAGRGGVVPPADCGRRKPWRCSCHFCHNKTGEREGLEGNEASRGFFPVFIRAGMALYIRFHAP